MYVDRETPSTCYMQVSRSRSTTSQVKNLKMSSSTDCRGVQRGNCSQCGCDQYNRGLEGMKCNCGHTPVKHVKMNTGNTLLAPAPSAMSPSLSSMSINADSSEVTSSLIQPSFDPNTGLDYDDDDESSLAGIAQDCFPLGDQSLASSMSSFGWVPVDQQCQLNGCIKKKYTGYDFCGITHARKFQEQNSNVPSTLQCKMPNCYKQRHSNDQGGYFDYCSKFCRDNREKPYDPMHASASMPIIALTSDGRCIFPECKRAKYRDPGNNRTHDFCGRTHAYEARMQGITSGSAAVNIRVATRQEFSVIVGKFQQTWATAKGPCPPVSFVYIITNTQLTQRWQTYQNGLQKKDVEHFYHGTKLTCNITVTSAPCNDQACGVCGITNTGLDRRCIRKNIQFQRFGHGFYLAPNSSKCHDYTQGSHSFRAMVAFDVCPGKRYPLTSDNVGLKGPPPGYDSVYGQAGGSLNYEELVVYNPDAALPKHIIVYKKSGEHKIAK